MLRVIDTNLGNKISRGIKMQFMQLVESSINNNKVIREHAQKRWIEFEMWKILKQKDKFKSFWTQNFWAFLEMKIEAFGLLKENWKLFELFKNLKLLSSFENHWSIWAFLNITELFELFQKNYWIIFLQSHFFLLKAFYFKVFFIHCIS